MTKAELIEEVSRVVEMTRKDSEVIVADIMNGSPLGEKQGPFKMVAPHDKRPARWIRMLKSLTVVSVAPPKP